MDEMIKLWRYLTAHDIINKYLKQSGGQANG